MNRVHTNFRARKVPVEASLGDILIALSVSFLGYIVQIGSAGLHASSYTGFYAPVYFVGLAAFVGGFIWLYYRQWHSDGMLNLGVEITGEKAEWVTVTETERKKLVEKVEAIDKTSSGCLRREVVAILLLFGFLSHIGLLLFLSDNRSGSGVIPVTFLNFFVLVGVYNLVFQIATWKPDTIIQKLPLFKALTDSLPRNGMGNWEAKYQFNMKTSDKGKVPTDIKLIVKPDECPDEFLGIHAQVAYNRGAPYLYFVLITKPTLRIIKPDVSKRAVGINIPLLSSFIKEQPTDLLEEKQQADVNVLVVRQIATKRSGYNTSREDEQRLLLLAKDAAKLTISERPAPAM